MMPAELSWPAPDFSRVPYAVVGSDEVFTREQERIFRGAGLVLSRP